MFELLFSPNHVQYISITKRVVPFPPHHRQHRLRVAAVEDVTEGVRSILSLWVSASCFRKVKNEDVPVDAQMFFFSPKVDLFMFLYHFVCLNDLVW